jgi:hypothetical protein
MRDASRRQIAPLSLECEESRRRRDERENNWYGEGPEVDIDGLGACEEWESCRGRVKKFDGGVGEHSKPVGANKRGDPKQRVGQGRRGKEVDRHTRQFVGESEGARNELESGKKFKREERGENLKVFELHQNTGASGAGDKRGGNTDGKQRQRYRACSCRREGANGKKKATGWIRGDRPKSQSGRGRPVRM